MKTPILTWKMNFIVLLGLSTACSSIPHAQDQLPFVKESELKLESTCIPSPRFGMDPSRSVYDARSGTLYYPHITENHSSNNEHLEYYLRCNRGEDPRIILAYNQADTWLCGDPVAFYHFWCGNRREATLTLYRFYSTTRNTVDPKGVGVLVLQAGPATIQLW